MLLFQNEESQRPMERCGMRAELEGKEQKEDGPLGLTVLPGISKMERGVKSCRLARNDIGGIPFINGNLISSNFGSGLNPSFQLSDFIDSLLRIDPKMI